MFPKIHFSGVFAVSIETTTYRPPPALIRPYVFSQGYLPRSRAFLLKLRPTAQFFALVFTPSTEATADQPAYMRQPPPPPSTPPTPPLIDRSCSLPPRHSLRLSMSSLHAMYGTFPETPATLGDADHSGILAAPLSKTILSWSLDTVRDTIPAFSPRTSGTPTSWECQSLPSTRFQDTIPPFHRLPRRRRPVGNVNHSPRHGSETPFPRFHRPPRPRRPFGNSCRFLLNIVLSQFSTNIRDTTAPLTATCAQPASSAPLCNVQGHQRPFSIQVFNPSFSGSKPPMAIQHSSMATKPWVIPSNSDSLAPKHPCFHLHRLYLVHLDARPAFHLSPFSGHVSCDTILSPTSTVLSVNTKTSAFRIPLFRIIFPALEYLVVEPLSPLSYPKPSCRPPPSDPVVCSLRS